MTAPNSPPTAAATSKLSLRILYAEDVAELRDLAQILLGREGHHVECEPDGAAALRRVVADAGFDLVLTDHHMPLMNGLELVAQLRRHNYQGKIMVFSSELSPAVELEYLRHNVDRILYKPVPPATLRTVLGEMFPAKGT